MTGEPSIGATPSSCAGSEPGSLAQAGGTPQIAEVLAPPPPSLPSRRAPESPHRQVEPLSADRFAVRFTGDAELLDLLEEVLALASHRNPKGDLLSTMKAGLEAYRRELLKGRFAVGRKPRAVAPSDAPAASPAEVAPQRLVRDESKVRRAVPANVARDVYERDRGRCTFIASDGRRCSARRFLEIDHIHPHGVGGDEQPDNLRLRCRAHNQHYAGQYFGRGYMASIMKRIREHKKHSG